MLHCAVRYSLLVALVWTVFGSASLQAQDVRIEELMASNVATIADEDGEYPDWIELYNDGTTPIQLGGYGLSDDPDEPFKWTMPDLRLEAGARLLVFASGNEREAVAHWETLIDQGDAWRYRVDTQPAAGWTTTGFDDGAWNNGPSGFGYADGDDATAVPQGTLVTFARTTFAVEDASTANRAVLHVDYDDGFVAYLNGTEIARGNVDGTAPGAGQAATTDREAHYYQGLPLDGFDIDDVRSLLQDGENVLAVQVHNISSQSSDLSLIPVFSVGLDAIPADPGSLSDLAAGLEAGRPHVPFKLSAEGEAVVLTAPDSARIDSVNFGPLPSDVSYGRGADDPDVWYLFETPTPGEPNGTGGFVGTTPSPTFSQPAGRYDAALTVSLDTADPDTEIRYTRDGSVPTDSSPRYVEPLTLTRTTVVRARAFRTGYVPGPTATATYLLQEDTELPVVTIATDPDNLWDYETGIYVPGPNATNDECANRRANYHQDWEIPVHISLIEPAETEPALALDAGVKIYGGCTRTFPQKSLAVFARGRYGTDAIEYRLLPEKPIDEYQAFILRNSGNDFGYTHFRDAMMQSLVKDVDIDRLAYRPAVVFLNGEYWGIHNIREKINEHYIAANHDVAPDEIDMLEGSSAAVIHGSDAHYREFLRYLDEHDMTSAADFDAVEAYIDVESFIDYQIAQIYYANEDWPGNNIKFWRPQRPGGRWRWIMYDTDFGFGLYNANRVYNNSLEFATEPDGPEWPNPPQSTFALRRLLLNETFERAFINRFADHLNETFTTERVNSVIDSLADGIRSEVPRHSERWNGALDGWNWRVGALRQFAETRPPLVWSHLRDFFALAAPAAVTVDAEPAGAGTVRVNRLLLDSFPWEGSYFQEVPVFAEAVPRPGYRFVEWSNGSSNPRTQINVNPRGITLTARFEAAEVNDADVVVNEIQYHPPDDLDSEDWVELLNTGEATIDLGGWYLVDDDSTHRFTLPDEAQVAGEGYLVLCRDAAAFAAAYPGAESCMGNWDFGLGSGGDMVRLYNASGALVDSVAFDDDVPWPVEADGDGATLELNGPQDDNSQAASWNASSQYGGTPSVDNGTSVAREHLSERPSQLALHPNHPNPFHGQTTIDYELPEPGHVFVRVYDILGSEVRTLVDAHQPAGRHSLRFEPDGLASGVYVYRLEASGRIQSQTMLLAK